MYGNDLSVWRLHRLRFLVLLLSIVIFSSLAACSAGTAGDDKENAEENKKNQVVRIPYVEWASETASAHVAKAAIEDRLGYSAEVLPVTNISMWESIAAGDQDGMVAAWMPTLHAKNYNEHKENMENLGPNLEGAITGLAVPEYVPIDSIEELNEHASAFDGKIIGIDPAAGVMAETEQAMETYKLHELELVTGSDSTMSQALGNAIEKEEWIVVTAWTPHWKFARWDLKYLDDPKNVYGDPEYINTMVRKGLKEDMPDVYNFFDNFYWEPSDMEQVMLWTEEQGVSSEEAAERWVQENEEKVDKWFKQ